MGPFSGGRGRRRGRGRSRARASVSPPGAGRGGGAERVSGGASRRRRGRSGRAGWAGRGRRRHLKAALPAAPGRAPPEGGGSARGPPPAPPPTPGRGSRDLPRRPRAPPARPAPLASPPPARARGGAGAPGSRPRAAAPPPFSGRPPGSPHAAPPPPRHPPSTPPRDHRATAARGGLRIGRMYPQGRHPVSGGPGLRRAGARAPGSSDPNVPPRPRFSPASPSSSRSWRSATASKRNFSFFRLSTTGEGGRGRPAPGGPGAHLGAPGRGAGLWGPPGAQPGGGGASRERGGGTPPPQEGGTASRWKAGEVHGDTQYWDTLSLRRGGKGLGPGGGVTIGKWGEGKEPNPSLWKVAQRGCPCVLHRVGCGGGRVAIEAGPSGTPCPISFPASSWNARSWPVRRQKCSDIMSW